MDIELNSQDIIRGEDMLSLAKTLFPLNRSLMGPDIRNSYQYFKARHPEFKTISFQSGEKVFDWEIPEEWIIKEAYIENEEGVKYAEFKKNNLHLMGYSTAINTKMSKEELLNKIYTHPNLEDAIPYTTSYYAKDWGFCLSKKEKESLPDGNYKVYINSFHKKGRLELIEAFIPGELKNEIFFSSYLCHPSMANNELSGPVLIDQLISYVKSLKNRKYSYRFVLLPETIGSIAYLSKKGNQIKPNMICGFNLTCVGDEKAYSHIASRLGDNLADRALKSSLKGLINYKSFSFLERGSDERQYCAPGIDLPLCTFCKSRFGDYIEYHSSKDDFNIVTSKGLSQSFKVMRNIIEAFEVGLYPKINVYCEPQLGKRGLYSDVSLFNGERTAKLRMDIIAYCDGVHSIFDISEKLNINLQSILKEITILIDERLIESKDI